MNVAKAQVDFSRQFFIRFKNGARLFEWMLITC